ncbi:MAG: citrate/2-methylcitrate synthase [Patescibacteria group bacterium]
MPEKIITTGLRGMEIAETKIVKLDHELKTILYRGYDLKDLAEKSCFEEVAYLLIKGRLPTRQKLQEFSKCLLENQVCQYTREANKLKIILDQISRNTHPMDILKFAVSFFGATTNSNQKTEILAINLLAKILSILEWITKANFKSLWLPNKSFTENTLRKITFKPPTPLAKKAFDISLMLYAEHELAASTFNARVTASTLSDYFSCILSAIGALKGPLHGGANEAVMQMLMEINDTKLTRKWIENALSKGQKIMGFGHPVYKNGDPRSPIIESYAKKLSEESREWKWYAMSKIIEEILLKEKGLYPNLDFYTATVYKLLDIPIKLFTPIFVLSRLTGWTAHIIEQQANNKIIRPGAKYVGLEKQIYIDIGERN